MRTSVLLFALLTACATESTSTVDNPATIDEHSDLIQCRVDRECPTDSYCEPGLNICFTGQRCIVNGRPSNEYCERMFDRSFACFEYAADSFHCVPTEEQR